MIRFTAVLSVVVAAVGLLVAGAISGSLLLVYLAIAVAALALLMLVVGVVIWRDEIFERVPAGSATGHESVGQLATATVAGSAPGDRELPSSADPSERPPVLIGTAPGGTAPGDAVPGDTAVGDTAVGDTAVGDTALADATPKGSAAKGTAAKGAAPEDDIRPADSVLAAGAFPASSPAPGERATREPGPDDPAAAGYSRRDEAAGPRVPDWPGLPRDRETPAAQRETTLWDSPPPSRHDQRDHPPATQDATSRAAAPGGASGRDAASRDADARAATSRAAATGAASGRDAASRDADARAASSRAADAGGASGRDAARRDAETWVVRSRGAEARDAAISGVDARPATGRDADSGDTRGRQDQPAARASGAATPDAEPGGPRPPVAAGSLGQASPADSPPSVDELLRRAGHEPGRSGRDAQAPATPGRSPSGTPPASSPERERPGRSERTDGSQHTMRLKKPSADAAPVQAAADPAPPEPARPGSGSARPPAEPGRTTPATGATPLGDRREQTRPSTEPDRQHDSGSAQAPMPTHARPDSRADPVRPDPVRPDPGRADTVRPDSVQATSPPATLAPAAAGKPDKAAASDVPPDHTAAAAAPNGHSVPGPDQPGPADDKPATSDDAPARPGPATGGSSSRGTGTAVVTEVTEVTVVPGIGRYHVADCILIRFLGSEDLDVMTRHAAEAAGCVPCKACRPT